MGETTAARTLGAWARRYASLVGSLLVMLVCVGVPRAAAHDVVIHSIPENGSTVSEFPHTIELEFSAIPLENFNRVALSNADTGEVFYQGEPELDQQFVRIDVPTNIQPGDGNYLVGFQITSSDGHATRGKTTFSVRSGGDDEGSAGQDGESALSSESTSSTPWMLIGSGIVLLVVIVGVILMMSKRKES